MHIAFNGWFWEQSNTGSGQYLRGLLSALRRLKPDLKLTLILPGAKPDDLPAAINVVTAGASRSNLAKVWFEQRTFPTLAAKAGADIAHVPYWGAPLSSPIPLVTSILDVIPLALPEYAAGFFPRLYTSLVSAAARGSSQTLTLSEAAKGDIVKYLELMPEQITPTHLAAGEAYHPRIGAKRDPDVRAKYDLPDQFILCGFGFDRRKRLDRAFQAFTYVAKAEGENTPLVIAGREPQWAEPMFPDLRALAKELEIEPYVRWLGYVDEADKPSLLRLASLYVFPSEYEGFGLPVLEAMACGTPVIASEIPVIQEIVGDGAYLVKPGDVRAMGGAMLALLLQNPLRETMITRGLARATYFSWRKTAIETYSVYERVLAGKA